MKRKIYLASILAIYKTNFQNQHAKFIHAFPTKSEDLNKEFAFEGKVLKLIGMNDDHQGVLHEAATGFHYVASLKMIKGLPESTYTVDDTSLAITEKISDTIVENAPEMILTEAETEAEVNA